MDNVLSKGMAYNVKDDDFTLIAGDKFNSLDSKRKLELSPALFRVCAAVSGHCTLFTPVVSLSLLLLSSFPVFSYSQIDKAAVCSWCSESYDKCTRVKVGGASYNKVTLRPTGSKGSYALLVCKTCLPQVYYVHSMIHFVIHCLSAEDSSEVALAVRLRETFVSLSKMIPTSFMSMDDVRRYRAPATCPVFNIVAVVSSDEALLPFAVIGNAADTARLFEQLSAPSLSASYSTDSNSSQSMNENTTDDISEIDVKVKKIRLRLKREAEARALIQGKKVKQSDHEVKVEHDLALLVEQRETQRTQLLAALRQEKLNNANVIDLDAAAQRKKRADELEFMRAANREKLKKKPKQTKKSDNPAEICHFCWHPRLAVQIKQIWQDSAKTYKCAERHSTFKQMVCPRCSDGTNTWSCAQCRVKKPCTGYFSAGVSYNAPPICDKCSF
jgi:hypothetical protein